jgi:hypothetical protein
MQKATATYHAPEGDSKVAEMGGVTFFDGKEVELNSDEHAHLMSKLKNNQHFDYEEGEDDGEETKADTSKRDWKAGVENARDHSFENDQRNQQADRDQRALTASGVGRRGPGRPPKAAVADSSQPNQNKNATLADQPPENKQPEEDKTPQEGGGEANPKGLTGTSPKPAGSE